MTIKQHGGVFGRNPTFNEIGGTLTTAAQPNITSLGTQTSNLAFASGNGIDFSATAGSGTSELFDDYEEGTFTATLESAGNTGATTLTSNVAKYTKIGDVVHIFCLVTGDQTLTDAGDYFEIGGLPFVATVYPSSNSPFNGVCHAGASILDDRVSTGICGVFEGSTKIDVYTNVAAIGATFGAGAINLTVSYTTAS